MAKRESHASSGSAGSTRASSPIEELMLAALDRGDDSLRTGRYLATFKEGAAEDGLQALRAQGIRVADARDFGEQAATADTIGDAGAVVLPEVGVALVGGDVAEERGMSAYAEIAADSPFEAVEPEYFMFVDGTPAE